MEVELKLRVPGSIPGIRMASEGLEGFTASHGLAPGAVWPFQVALDEVLANIVKHGLRGAQEAHEMEIEVRLRETVLEVTVSDDAPAFNPLEAGEADTTLAAEERPMGGLGISLVRKLMESVAYERRGDRNRLVFRRSVNQQPKG